MYRVIEITVGLLFDVIELAAIGSAVILFGLLLIGLKG